MDMLVSAVSASTLTMIETLINDWVLYISLGVFAFELLRYALVKRLGWNVLGDSAANSVIFVGYLFISYTLFYSLYILLFYTVHEFALFEIETTWASLLICIVLADLAYYWEHRFAHRVGIAWATHEVHHSSPHFNISVAYRFGPMDDVWPILFYLPLVLVGFDPLVVFFSSLVVLQYQTLLHTEAVKKLPWPIEAVLNTPSHHRVHHGSNPQYLDKNYAGMLIVWDRLFGTFAKEEEPVVYGLTKQIESVNPLLIFFHGLYDLGQKIARTPGIADKARRVILPPDWEPEGSRPKPASSSAPAE